MNEPKPESIERQYRRLESKVNVLTRLSIAQTFILTILLVMSFMPSTSTIVVLILVVIAFVAVFQKQLPTWTAWFWRTLRSFLRGNDSTQSGKERI